MSETTKYVHARYFIGRPNRGPKWEVGDRSNGCDQVAECLNKAKAVRVWRGLIALDGEPLSDSLAALENESLREGLAESERVIGDLQCELSSANDRLKKARQAMDVMRESLE